MERAAKIAKVFLGPPTAAEWDQHVGLVESWEQYNRICHHLEVDALAWPNPPEPKFAGKQGRAASDAAASVTPANPL